MSEIGYKLNTGRSVRVTRVPDRVLDGVATYGIRYADNGEIIGHPDVRDAEPLVDWIEQQTGATVTGTIEGSNVVPLKSKRSGTPPRA